MLLLSCREYLALGTVFFSPNLKFFELLRKRAKILIFFKKNAFFALFLSKIRKILDFIKKTKIRS